MYNLKEVSEKVNKPLRTIQNWFKDAQESGINPTTGAKQYTEETVEEVLKKHGLTLNEAISNETETTAQDDAQLRADDAPKRASEDNVLFSLLEKQISFYQSQLEEKDKQISNLSASLAKSNELLQNEQQLNLLNLKQIEDLKAQLLLEQPKEEVKEVKETVETVENPEKVKKKSFFPVFLIYKHGRRA